MKDMKTYGRFIWLCFFVCLFVSFGFSQGNMKDDFQLDKNNLSTNLLTISDSDLKFKQGDKLQIEITLKNTTKEEIYFLRGNTLDDFSVEIKDEKGEIVSLSQEAKLRNELPKTGSRYLAKLKPNEEYKFELDLSKLYLLQKRKYIITVTRIVLKEDKRNAFYAKSKSRKIIIS
jgi:hypothetical protein